MTEKQYPELPDPTAWRSFDNLLKRARYDAVPITSTQPGIYSHTRMFTEDQARAFADATCAMRAEQAAPAAQGDALNAAQRDQLLAFTKEVMQAWPEGGIDGGELQDIALAHGLLRMAEPPPDWDGCNFYELTELIK